jgi:hypothetical protein
MDNGQIYALTMTIPLWVCIIALVMLADPISALITKRGGEKHNPFVEWLKITALVLLAVLPYVDSVNSAKELAESKKIATVAQDQAAIANQRASALETAGAPRQFSLIAASAVDNAIKPYPGTMVDMSCQAGDTEAGNFCQSLAGVLHAGGWNIVSLVLGGFNSGQNQYDPIGVVYDPSLKAPATAMITALNAAGFSAIGHPIDLPDKRKTTLTIWVGKKT